MIKCKIGIDESPKIANCEIVVMNPPWGFQTSRADRPLNYGFTSNQIQCMLFILRNQPT